MKKLTLLLLLVLCSNFITKAWCVLCVRERSALELLKQENDHTIFQTVVTNHKRIMLEEVTVTNLDDNTTLTLEEKCDYNFVEDNSTKGIKHTILGVNVSPEDYENAWTKSEETKNVF